MNHKNWIVQNSWTHCKEWWIVAFTFITSGAAFIDHAVTNTSIFFSVSKELICFIRTIYPPGRPTSPTIFLYVAYIYTPLKHLNYTHISASHHAYTHACQSHIPLLDSWFMVNRFTLHILVKLYLKYMMVSGLPGLRPLKTSWKWSSLTIKCGRPAQPCGYNH